MENIGRKEPQTMDKVMLDYIKEMKLAAGLNTQIIFRVWDEVSGAGKYTVRKFFRDGTLYITLGSSMARNSLSFRIPELIRDMNDRILMDPLFVKDDPRSHLVTKLILK